MKDCWVVLLICISLFSFGCQTSTVDEDKQKAILHLQLGTSHLLQKNYPQALRELLEGERLDPKNPVIKNNLGLAYLVRERYIEAEKSFRQALRIDPNYTDAKNNLGRLYIDLGFYDKALIELEAATQDLTYESPEKSWGNLGQLYYLTGKFTDAKNALKNSLKTKKESCFTTNLYGRVLFELKNFKEAAESLDQAIKLCEKSNFEEPYFYSGMSFYKLGKLDLAKARFGEIRRLNPNGVYAKKAAEMLEIIK